MKTMVMTHDSLRILQLTDLHLMKLPTDDETFQLITVMIERHHPDLIIITGDLTMTNDNQSLLLSLRDFLDGFQIPWTFVFGNHDHEAILSLWEQADLLMESSYCLFEKGNSDLPGCGNHYIAISYQNSVRFLLGMIDSHNDVVITKEGQSVWSYDYIRQSQIDDCLNMIDNLKERNRALSSLFFFHIPLVEFKTQLETKANEIVGECHESISCSLVDSTFFPQLQVTNTLKGIFVGHDHVCDFSFEKEGCLFAFGRCSGHYNYTLPTFKKGVRIIDLNKNGSIMSQIFIED